jgi:hypothetical protein
MHGTGVLGRGWDPGGGGDGYRGSSLPGSASNFVPQPLEQKYQVRPPYLTEAAAFSGRTFMPQTGSISATTASVTRAPACCFRTLTRSEDSAKDLDSFGPMSIRKVEVSAMVSHISRKTSEMWGTHRPSAMTVLQVKRSSGIDHRCLSGSTCPRIGFGQVPDRPAIEIAPGWRPSQSRPAPVLPR